MAYAYYMYQVNGAGKIQAVTGPAQVIESDGSLFDSKGGNADTFTIVGSTDSYVFEGGYPIGSGTHAGDFTAKDTTTGVRYFFSSSPTLTVDAFTQTFGGYVDNSDTLEVQLTCFLAGTMIRTQGGETAVDKLAIGDLVVTGDGSDKPVKFIGRQTVSMLFTDKLKSQPILIKAGALAENVPARDLYTSPGHAMLVDGVLAIAGALVNGRSIVRWTEVPSVFTYYHIELEGHEIVFAEGAATETYCDNVPREVFDNAAEYKALYPNATPIPQIDLPTVKSQRQLPAGTRRRLAERAIAIGATTIQAKVA